MLEGWPEKAGGIAAIVAVSGVLWRIWTYISEGRTLRSRALKIEELLERKTAPNDDSLTVSQIAAHFNWTEAQVCEAVSKNKRIEPLSGQLGNERRMRIVRK